MLFAAFGSIAGWLTMIVLLGRGWAGSLESWTGRRLSFHQWLRLQAIAWLGRYLPGKFGLLAGKMQACELGINWKQVTGSVLSEQTAYIASGFALSTLALPYWLPIFSEVPSRYSESALIAALFLPALVGGAFGIWSAGKLLPKAKKPWYAYLLIWSALAHFAAGMGFHIFLASILPSPPSLLISIGLLAAAHTAGVLAIFAPAGLGIREAVIVAALAPQLGLAQAAALAALQRALVAIGDVSVALFALAFRKKPIHSDN